MPAKVRQNSVQPNLISHSFAPKNVTVKPFMIHLLSCELTLIQQSVCPLQP
jgi:hypothetical protein